jgi:hypothetical protein
VSKRVGGEQITEFIIDFWNGQFRDRRNACDEQQCCCADCGYASAAISSESAKCVFDMPKPAKAFMWRQKRQPN